MAGIAQRGAKAAQDRAAAERRLRRALEILDLTEIDLNGLPKLRERRRSGVGSVAAGGDNSVVAVGERTAEDRPFHASDASDHPDKRRRGQRLEQIRRQLRKVENLES